MLAMVIAVIPLYSAQLLVSLIRIGKFTYVFYVLGCYCGVVCCGSTTAKSCSTVLNRNMVLVPLLVLEVGQSFSYSQCQAW